MTVSRDEAFVGHLDSEQCTSAERLKAALREHPADEAFADDVEAARVELRSVLADEAKGWPAE